MASHTEWARGFARQAQADFEAYRALAVSAPACQWLHFIQMACEKLVKAHLYFEGKPPGNVRSSHALTKKHLARIVEAEMIQQGCAIHMIRAAMSCANRMAGEINYLSPSVKQDGKRKNNCEYPWEDNQGNLHVPIDHRFLAESLLQEKNASLVLKVIKAAIDRLVR